MRVVEYLYGQTVTGVRQREGFGWALKFASGNELIYEESDVVSPEFVNHVFTNATFSKDKATLYFHKAKADGTPSKGKPTKVELKPMAVGVKDATGAVVWPARAEEKVEPLPDDPSPQRVAEGPDEQFHEDDE
jgi:hypothetical protein